MTLCSSIMARKRFKQPVGFRLPPSVVELLEDFSSQMGWTKTDTIAVALDHFARDVSVGDRVKALGVYKGRLAAAEREKPPKAVTAKPRASK